MGGLILGAQYIHEAPILEKTSGWTLDLDHPGNRGWLLEFVRLAYEIPSIFCLSSMDEEEGLVGWDVRTHLRYGSRSLATGKTEGEALATAIINRAATLAAGSARPEPTP